MKITPCRYYSAFALSILLCITFAFSAVSCTNPKPDDSPKVEDTPQDTEDNTSENQTLGKDNRIWMLALNIAQGVSDSYERDVISELIAERLAIGGFLGDAHELAGRIEDPYHKAQALSTVAQYFIVIYETDTADKILNESLESVKKIDSSMDRLSVLTSIQSAYKMLKNEEKSTALTTEINDLRKEIRGKFSFSDLSSDPSFEILDRIDTTTVDAEELIDMGEYDQSMGLVQTYNDPASTAVTLSYLAIILQSREEQLTEEMSKQLDIIQIKYK